jgi:hypothetical protein
LGLLLTLEYCKIPQNRKTAILQIPLLKTKRDILSFLGLTGYFRIWIPDYSIVAKPLYEAAREDPDELLPCPRTPPPSPFNLLKQALSRASALSIPNPNKLFTYTYTQTKARLGGSNNLPLKTARPRLQG